METEILLLRRQLKKLENDPDILKLEKWYMEFKFIRLVTNDPRCIEVSNLLENFHEKFLIHKQIMRDCICMNFDKMRPQEMKSILGESTKELCSLLDQIKKVVV